MREPSNFVFKDKLYSSRNRLIEYVFNHGKLNRTQTMENTTESIKNFDGIFLEPKNFSVEEIFYNECLHDYMMNVWVLMKS